MKSLTFLFTCILLLAACSDAPTTSTTSTPLSSPTAILPSSTPRNLMLPTWTPAPTTTPAPTPTPRPTSTPVVYVSSEAFLYSDQLDAPAPGLYLDRPSYATLPKPADQVSMQFDSSRWSLTTFYLDADPNGYMHYSLTHSSNFGCKLEPVLEGGAEGYQLEQFNRPFGSSPFQVTRVSQAGVLIYTNYCTGEGDRKACFRLSPGTDHAACTADTEAVLSTYEIFSNPFFGSTAASQNQWSCQDTSGTEGLCLVSYSVPLNALAFVEDGEGWIAGDDGLIFHRSGGVWSQVASPSIHPIYDLSFSNPTDGWAVGAGAQVLHWDGTTWNEILPFHGPGEGPGGSTQVLYAVHAISPSDAWMVGSNKAIDGKYYPYALHWNGTDLIEQNTFPDCNCGLNAVSIIGTDQVMATGGSDLGAVAMLWDGTAWSKTYIPGADDLYTLTQAADGTLWAAGIEVARDQSDTRGSLFHWDRVNWIRYATPPLTGGMYALAMLPDGQIVLGGDFTALGSSLAWEPIATAIAGYGWIVDIEMDSQGNVWALTHSGNLFQLELIP